MATLFTKYSSYITSGSNKARLKLVCTYDQHPAGTYTDITETLSLEITGSPWTEVEDGSITGTGATASNLSGSGSSTYTLGNATKRMWHKAKNGTCTFTSGAAATVTLSTVIETLTISSSTYSLPTIDVYNDLTFSDTEPDMGDTITISVALAPASTYSIIYANDVQIYSGAGPYSWTVPQYTLTETDYANVTVSSVAYNSSGTKLGTRTYTIKAYLDPTIKPEVSVVVSNQSPYASFTSHIIGKAKLSLALTADMSADTGATIATYSYSLANGSTIYSSGTYASTASSYTINVPEVVQGTSNTLTYSITDSRGRTTSHTATITNVAYTQPAISVSAQRCTSSGAVSESGAYLKLTYNWNVQNIDNLNVITQGIKCFLSVEGGNYNQVDTYTPSTLSGSYTSTVYPALAVTSAGSLYITIADTLGGSVQSNVYTISRKAVPFSLYDDGAGNVGAAFGKVASSSEIYSELPVHWNTNSLPESTSSQFLVTIDSFADGGTQKWINTSNVSVGSATNATNAANNGVTLFTGIILGGNSASVNCSEYDFIDVYIRDYSCVVCVRVSLIDAYTTYDGSAWTSAHYYRGSNSFTLFNSSTSIETHYAHVGVSSDKQTVYLPSIGYYKSFSNLTTRLNNAAYGIIRIVGYKKVS